MRAFGLAALLACVAASGLALAVGQARRAVRSAELQVLQDETVVGVNLLREADGAGRVAAALGDRWHVRQEVDPLLGEAQVDDERSPTGAAVARGAVLDADEWNAIGQLVVEEDVAARASLPLGILALALTSGAALLASGMVVVSWVGRRGPSGSIVASLVAWVGCAIVCVAPTSIAAARWSSTALERLTQRRLAIGAGALEGRVDLAALVRRPSGVLNLTGLRSVIVDAALVREGGGEGAETRRFAGAGLPADVARTLSASSVGAGHATVVDAVPYATRDVDGVRLVMLPFEHTHRSGGAMAAVAGIGILAGTPVLVLASFGHDRRRLRRELTSWTFLAPGLVHLGAFTAGPLVFAAWLSVHRWSLIDPATPFVGLANYLAVARDAGFWHAVRNTALFTLHVPVSMVVALGLALLVRREGRSSVAARAAFFLPSITSLVAVAMVWEWMLNDEYGLVNAALGAIGAPRVAWLSSPTAALLSIMIVATWTTVGFETVLFQAGLTAIPRDLYDAARIDGASRWRQFVHVTLPGLRSTLVFVLITSVIGSFQVFGLVYVMTEGGPLHATDVAVFHIYEEAWELQRVGSAAAMSWVLFAVIFVVTWVHFRVLERRAA